MLNPLENSISCVGIFFPCNALKSAALLLTTGPLEPLEGGGGGGSGTSSIDGGGPSGGGGGPSSDEWVGGVDMPEVGGGEGEGVNPLNSVGRLAFL